MPWATQFQFKLKEIINKHSYRYLFSSFCSLPRKNNYSDSHIKNVTAQAPRGARKELNQDRLSYRRVVTSRIIPFVPEKSSNSLENPAPWWIWHREISIHSSVTVSILAPYPREVHGKFSICRFWNVRGNWMFRHFLSAIFTSPSHLVNLI